MGSTRPSHKSTDLTLSAATCLAEFPAFYPQLEAKAQYWKHRGGISQPLLDSTELFSSAGGHLRVLIQDDHLFLRSHVPNAGPRTSAVLGLLNLAIQGNQAIKDGVLPAVDVVLIMGGKENVDAPGWLLNEPHGDVQTPGQWLLVSGTLS